MKSHPLKEAAAVLCFAGTLSTVVGFCGLFVQNAPVNSKDADKFEQMKATGEFFGFTGAGLFAVTFPILMMPIKKDAD